MLYPSGATRYRKIKTQEISFKDGLLSIPAQVFTDLAFEAFKDVSFLLRQEHLTQLRSLFDDESSSANERFIALELLKNANISAGMILPLCQDTGTATVFGEKGHMVLTDGKEAEALTAGIKKAYSDLNLRYSINVPDTLFEEHNSKNNLPAQIDLTASTGNEYDFLFIAKGGGSSNKTFLFQESKALLNKEALTCFLNEKIKSIGVSACPPYHLAIVIGGLSPEMTLKTVKLAAAHALDELPDGENGFRDIPMEQEILNTVNDNGLGAQFGGKHFCLDVRVIRLPRHGASLPIGIGVSCVADRNILGKITPEGAFLEALEINPAAYLPEIKKEKHTGTEVKIDLERPIQETLADLSSLKVGQRLLLNGPLIVARDIAHARFMNRLKSGKALPEYLKKYPIFYAGPAKKPMNFPSGALGPTTAGRMDGYVQAFQEKGASLIMLGKGSRSAGVVDSCKTYGGFYLGAPGGTAAQTAAAYIMSCEELDFTDLGMEAVFKITVKNMPAFLIIDNKGNDLYRLLETKTRT